MSAPRAAAQPKGRQSFSLQASLLTPCRSTSGYARRSRLAWTEKPLPQNTSHLGDTTLAGRGLCALLRIDPKPAQGARQAHEATQAYSELPMKMPAHPG